MTGWENGVDVSVAPRDEGSRLGAAGRNALVTTIRSQPGTATRLEVTYDLRYDGSEDKQVIIVHVSPVPSKTS